MKKLIAVLLGAAIGLSSAAGFAAPVGENQPKHEIGAQAKPAPQAPQKLEKRKAAPKKAHAKKRHVNKHQAQKHQVKKVRKAPVKGAQRTPAPMADHAPAK